MPALQFSVAADHPVFTGHFPGDPVVPGAMILQQMLLPLAPQFPLRLKKVRFEKVLRPEQSVQLVVDDGPAQSKLQALVGGEVIASALWLKPESLREASPAVYTALAIERLKSLTRDELAPLMPHQGAMLLLDGVDACDNRQLRARAVSHRRQDNPLSTQGRLSSLVLPEYAAQAAAAHAVLMSDSGGAESSGRGLLVLLPSVALYCEYIDNLAEPLVIEISVLLSREQSRIYSFQVSSAGALLASGELAVMYA